MIKKILHTFWNSKSSSKHCINGDFPLSRIKQQLYFILNRFHNSLELKKTEPNVSFHSYKGINPSILEVNKRSPSRFMSDLFWKQLDWGLLEKSLGKLSIVDLGCGKGQYLTYWSEVSNQRIKKYKGYDVQERDQWKELEEHFPIAHFQTLEASKIPHSDLDDVSLILSQSVLEHIEDDLYFFKLLANYVESRVDPLVQIHLIPAPSGLDMWRLHGVRQYTPRSLSKIAQFFPNSKVDIIAMGGRQSNQVHLDYITNPIYGKGIDFRETKEKEYNNAVVQAIKNDLESASSDHPSFYALIISHKCEVNLNSLTQSPDEAISSINDLGVFSETSILLDIGANVGNITQEMANTGATVYAFEPNPYAFAKLEERFKKNDKVHCINKAVLDKNISIPLYFHEHSDEDEVKWSVGSSLLEFKGNINKEKKHLVETIDLSEFIFNLTQPVDLIKMDIEGVEVEVINHLIETRAIDQIKKMVVETHEKKIPELRKSTLKLKQKIASLHLDNKIFLDWI